MSSEADDTSGRFVSRSPEQMSEAGDEPTESNDGVGAREAYHDEPAPNGHYTIHLASDTRAEVRGNESEEDVYDDDADETEEEDEEEDEDEDEDEEPTLKYERLGGSVHDLLQKDSAAALVYSNKRLVCLLFIHVWSSTYLISRSFLVHMLASFTYWTSMERELSPLNPILRA
jgi:vacuolar protein sorting-associated protein 41